MGNSNFKSFKVLIEMKHQKKTSPLGEKNLEQGIRSGSILFVETN